LTAREYFAGPTGIGHWTSLHRPTGIDPEFATEACLPVDGRRAVSAPDERSLPMWVAQTISGFLLLYLSAGLLFGSAFLTAGVGKVDAAARGASVLFRLLILPATVALWPFLAVKWIKVCLNGATP
jgi:hypothetical protein